MDTKSKTIGIISILFLLNLMPITSSSIVRVDHLVQPSIDSPIVDIQSPEDNTTFYFSQNISVIGYAFDDIGIVEFGYTVLWDTGFVTDITPISQTTFYEFNLPVMIYNGRNEITVYAIDDEGNWGNMTIVVFFQKYARILYVDDDGTADFTWIQDAVQNAHDGDTVYVYNGTYTDYFSGNMACVSIEKNIKLIGENKYSTIIKGIGFQRVIIIAAEEVSVSGFTIQHGVESTDRDWALGIDILNYRSDKIKIFDNIITHSSYGIHTHQTSANIHVYDNLICNNYYGIECEFDSTPINIYNNVIKENEYGLYTVSSQINLTHNCITDNRYGICDSRSESHYTMLENEISGNDIGLRLDTSITTIKHNNFLNNGDHVSVSMDVMLILFPLYWHYRNEWMSNYWDDWTTGIPLPIKGRANFYILILKIHPKLTTPLKISIFPYVEYDKNPAQEPYTI